FLLSRHLLRDWVQRRLACYPKYAALLDSVAEERWKTLIFMRLYPFLPVSFKNYCFGVTDVPLHVFVLATAIAGLPSVLLYSYLGSAGNVSLKAGSSSWSQTDYALFSIGLLVAIALAALATWYGK